MELTKGNDMIDPQVVADAMLELKNDTHFVVEQKRAEMVDAINNALDLFLQKFDTILDTATQRILG
jgi:predicted nuclease of restriction endonuclease-like (RecB) superfamily